MTDNRDLLNKVEKNIKKVLTNGRPYNIITLALSERKEILESTRNDNFIEMML